MKGHIMYLASRYAQPRDEHHASGKSGFRLTRREREVLALLCEGLPNKRICQRLAISAGTVKVHIGAILRELGVSSRLQAVLLAQRYGLVDTAHGVFAMA